MAFHLCNGQIVRLNKTTNTYWEYFNTSKKTYMKTQLFMKRKNLKVKIFNLYTKTRNISLRGVYNALKAVK